MAGLDDGFFAADGAESTSTLDDFKGIIKEPATTETRADDTAGGSQSEEVETETEAQDTVAGAEAEAEAVADDEASPVSHGRLNALLAERDRRQAAERRTQELEAQLAAAQTQQQPGRQPQGQPYKLPPMPDALMEPDRFQAWLDQRDYLQREQMSQIRAVDKHGADVVQAAEMALNRAVQADPSLAQRVQSHPDPYGFAIAWHKRQSLEQEIGGVESIDELIEREAAKRGYVKAGSGAPVVGQPVIVQPNVTLPPRSMASAAAVPRGHPTDLASSDFERKLFGAK